MGETDGERWREMETGAKLMVGHCEEMVLYMDLGRRPIRRPAGVNT